MKKITGLITISIVIGVILTGCASLLYGVKISSTGNISSVVAGGTIKLRSSGKDIIWSVGSEIDGTGPIAPGTFVSQSGELAVGPGETAQFLYVRAFSTHNEEFDVRQIRVVTVTGIAVTPANQFVAIGRSFQFSAQVLGNNNPDNVVTWRVSSNAAGTGSVSQGTGINANGLLTVAAGESFRTLYVIGTSVIDPTKSGNVAVNIVVPTVTSVTVSPQDQSMTSGNTLQFYALVTGTYEPANTVTWKVSSNSAGTGAVTAGTNIDSNGLLTVAANESFTTLFIVATSTVDSTKSGSVTVSVVRERERNRQ
jgi:hypothetical protein